MVWPKKDSIQHIEQYPILPYWPFWALAILTKKILCFTTALLYRQETYCESSAPCPEGTQKFRGVDTLCSINIMELQKMLIAFYYFFAYYHETDLDEFIGLYQEH